MIETAQAQAARQLVAALLERPPESVALEHRLLHELGMDSLALLELVMALDQRWGVALDAEQLHQLATVADVARLLPADACFPIMAEPVPQ